MTPNLTGHNAATDPLIPAMGASGPVRVSLTDALIDAHHLAGPSLERPLAVLPVMRLLVALARRIFGLTTPFDVRHLWNAGIFDADCVRHYLSEHHDRFDLFHPEHPFLQVAGLQPVSGHPKGTAGLLLNVATGNNVPLFSPFTEADTIPLSTSDALLSLLTTLGWDTAAIKTGAVGDPRVSGGKTTGNPTGPLGQLGAVIPLGRNLFETILLNVPILPEVEGDRPTWERDLPPTWESRQPTGPMEWLTWPSRRIRLIRDDSAETVTATVIAAGDRALFTPMFEPNTRWRSTTGDEVARRPMRWRSGSQAWRGLDTLITLNSLDSGASDQVGAPPMVLDQLRGDGIDLEPTYPLSLLCLGVTYGNQSAVVEDVFVDTLPLPVAALRSGDGAVAEAVREVAASGERLRRVINGLADNLRLVTGADKLPWDAGDHPGNNAVGLLREPTNRLLRGLQRDPDAYAAGLLAWQTVAEQVAWDAARPMLDQATPQAFVGRMVSSGSGERRLRLSVAEAWFRKGLREALPALFETRKQRKEDR